MNISQDELRKAATSSGISGEQADLLWQALQTKPTVSEKPKFDVANVAYYLGALIVIGAMGWFMNKAWESFGGGGLLAVASCYGVCFVLSGRTLWQQQLQIPGGLLITMAVCMIPLAVYGLERWTGFWPAGDPGQYVNFHPYINGSWLLMEVATVLGGIIALRFWRFPFLTAPIAYPVRPVNHAFEMEHHLIGVGRVRRQRRHRHKLQLGGQLGGGRGRVAGGGVAQNHHGGVQAEEGGCQCRPGQGELNRSASGRDVQRNGGLPFIRQRRPHFQGGVVHAGRKGRDKIQVGFHDGNGVDDRGICGNGGHRPPAPKHGAQPEQCPARLIHGLVSLTVVLCLSGCLPKLAGTARCAVPARQRSEGGTKVQVASLGRSFPLPDLPRRARARRALRSATGPAQRAIPTTPNFVNKSDKHAVV